MPAVRVALLVVAFLVLPAAAKADGLPVKTLSLEKKAEAYEVTIEYPATGNAGIDGEMAAWATQQAEDFVKLAAGADRQPGDNPYELDWSYEVARNDGAVFAVIFSEEMDTGGAHPNHDFATFNFEVPSGWRLYLPEIFDRRALQRISALAIADLKKQVAANDKDGGDPDWIKQGAGPYWDNFRDFILAKDKLEIHYPDYQVAAYAEGPQETDIPLAALKGFMRTDRRAPVASFDCAAASTAVEKAICSDTVLARLDREVADAYLRGVRYAVDAAAKGKLTAEQRTWLKERDAACTTAAVACLTAAYGDRLAKLAR